MSSYSNEFIIGSNALTASAAVLVWDFLVTLDNEINYMWMQPWTAGTLLFAINRYLPFIDTSLALYLQMSVTTPKMCLQYYTAITWMIACGLMMSELILLLRTWAMWERKKVIFFLLGGMSSLTFGPGIALTQLEIRSLKFEEVPAGGRGCNLVKASKLIMVSYVLIAFSETVVVALTFIKGWGHLRSSRASWVGHIYRHGLLFYVYLLAITILNMVVPLVASEPLYKNYLAVPQRVFHSIFCNRVILLISKHRAEHSYNSVELTRQRSITKTNLSGNMLDTAINTNFTRGDIDIQSVTGEDDDIRLTTYRRDWTR